MIKEKSAERSTLITGLLISKGEREANKNNIQYLKINSK